MSPVEIHWQDSPIDRLQAENPSNDGKLRRDAAVYSGGKVAAVYGDSLLVGVYSPESPVIYDAPDGAGYIKPGNALWSALSYTGRCGIIWGAGAKDLPMLSKWADVGLSRPQMAVRLEALESRTAQVKSMLDSRETALASLTGSDWVGAYVSFHIAGIKYSDAVMKTANGDFTAARKSLDEAGGLLSQSRPRLTSRAKGRVLSGIADGYPFLANDKVVCIWSQPSAGCGLIGMYDRLSQHEYPRLVAFAAELPKTPAGKVNRKALREQESGTKAA